MIVCETARLRLRHLLDSDAPFILALLNEPDFIRNIGDREVRTAEDARRYIQHGPTASYSQHGFGLWLVELRDSGDPIGICGLLKRDYLEHPDLGFALLPAFERRGFAYEAAHAVLNEAFSVMKFQKVLAISLPENLASIRLLKRLGFEYRDQLQHENELLASFEVRSEVFLALLSVPGSPARSTAS